MPREPSAGTTGVGSLAEGHQEVAHLRARVKSVRRRAHVFRVMKSALVDVRGDAFCQGGNRMRRVASRRRRENGAVHDVQPGIFEDLREMVHDS